jgi:putative phosphoribosyl transferase
VDAATVQEQREVARREHIYRNDRPLPHLQQRTVILVDDGIATGATIRAAIAAVRSQQPTHVVVAAPVAAAETCEALRREVEELACVLEPDVFFGVGFWYQDFPQITDEEVRALLARAWEAEAQQHQ